MARIAIRGAILLSLAACSYGPEPDRRTDYVVLFPPGQTELAGTQREVIGWAAAAARALPGSTVTVAGYADPARAPQSNQIESRIRAQLVADALVQGGVPRSAVRVAPRRGIGGDPGIESGRVDIRIEP